MKRSRLWSFTAFCLVVAGLICGLAADQADILTRLACVVMVCTGAVLLAASNILEKLGG